MAVLLPIVTFQYRKHLRFAGPSSESSYMEQIDLWRTVSAKTGEQVTGLAE